MGNKEGYEYEEDYKEEEDFCGDEEGYDDLEDVYVEGEEVYSESGGIILQCVTCDKCGSSCFTISKTQKYVCEKCGNVTYLFSGVEDVTLLEKYKNELISILDSIHDNTAFIINVENREEFDGLVESLGIEFGNKEI